MIPKKKCEPEKKVISPFKKMNNLKDENPEIIEKIKKQIIRPEFDIEFEQIPMMDLKIQQFYKDCFEFGDSIDQTFEFEYIYYILNCYKYIDEYLNLYNQPQNGFIKKITEQSQEEEIKKRNEINKKNHCIKNFCTSISPLFKVKCYLEYFSKTRCINQNCLSTNIDKLEEFTFICIDCNTVIQKLNNILSYRDSEKFLSKPKYRYEPLIHLVKAMRFHQGLVSPPDEEEILAYINHEMELLRIPSKELKKKDLLQILSSNKKFSKNYIYINYLHSQITKMPPPNIQKYEDKLIEFHSLYIEKYNEIKNPDSKNSQNIYFILFKLLQLAGENVRTCDFYSLKSIDNFNKNVEKFEKVRILCGWKKFPLFDNFE